MTPADRDDWLAVIEADAIIERLRFQSDLRFARGFDQAGSNGAQRERDSLVARANTLLMNAPDETGADAWNRLKAGTSAAIRGKVLPIRK